MNSIRFTLLTAVAALMLMAVAGNVRANQTNVTFSSGAVIESAANQYVDIDEVALGDLRVKGRLNVAANASRKSYIAFNLAGKSPNTNLNAVLSLRRKSSSGDQHLQLWILDQAFPGMGSNLVWGTNPDGIPAGASSGQAHCPTNMSMFTNGPFTATLFADQLVSGGNVTDDFTVPAHWGKYLFNGKIVFVVSSDPETNGSPTGSAGYRIEFLPGTNPPPTLKFTDTFGNQPPNITDTTNMTIYSHLTSAPIPFTVTDDSTAASNINLHAVSDDTTVAGGFTYTGQGVSGSRTLTFAARAAGTATVTVYVDDGSATNFTQFFVTVLANPTITAPSWTNTYGVTPVTSGFTVGDALYPVSTITNGATSGNSTLVADNNITFGGGTGPDRTVTVTAQPGMDGVAVINLVAGNTNGTTPAAYPVMVLPDANTFFSDHFNYPDGNLGLGSANFWAQRSVGTVRLRSFAGKAKIRDNASGESLVAPLAGGPYSSGVIYVGFNVVWTNLVSTNNGYFMSLYDPAQAIQCARVYTKTNDSDPSIHEISIACQSGPVSYSNQAGILQLALNTNYRIVIGYDIQGGTFSPASLTSARMWVNQTSESGPFVQANDSAAFALITHIQLRQNVGTGGDNFVDDLKVGSSFAAVLPSEPTVETPAFTPAAGTYTSAQTVTISSSSAFFYNGVKIRYTLDGSDPTPTTGTLYTAPVSVSANATLKAIAYASGMPDSPVASGTYTVQTVATKPVITKINLVANSVQIDFTNSVTDLPTDFHLLNADSLPVPFTTAPFTTNLSAGITQLGSGSFRATVTPLPSGNKFYIIQR